MSAYLKRTGAGVAELGSPNSPAVSRRPKEPALLSLSASEPPGVAASNPVALVKGRVPEPGHWARECASLGEWWCQRSCFLLLLSFFSFLCCLLFSWAELGWGWRDGTDRSTNPSQGKGEEARREKEETGAEGLIAQSRNLDLKCSAFLTPRRFNRRTVQVLRFFYGTFMHYIVWLPKWK